MKNKHIPIRKCMGCGSKKPKENFIRIVSSNKNNEKKVLVDETYKMDGRGIYICKELECLKRTKKSRRLERTFSCRVDETFYSELERMIC